MSLFSKTNSREPKKLRNRIYRSALRSLIPDLIEFFIQVWIVAGWDVVRQARRPFFFVSRMMLSCFVSLQVVYMWSMLFEGTFGSSIPVQSTAAEISMRVQSIFSTSIFIMSLGIVLLCPALTVGAIAGDRERKIWYDLINSPLSGWSIVMGKMCGRLATVVAWILVVMPVWAILGLAGGLDPKLVGITFIALFLYGWLYAGIGLLASVMTSRTRDAFGLATSIVILLMISPGLGDLVYLSLVKNPYFGASPWMLLPIRSLAVFNPMISMQLAVNGTLGLIRGPEYFLVMIASGPILTFISGLLLRPMSQRLENKTVERTNRLSAALGVYSASDIYRKSDRESIFHRLVFSPLAIKERRVRIGSRFSRLSKQFVSSLLLIIGGYYVITMFYLALDELSIYGISSTTRMRRNQFNGLIVGIAGLLHMTFMLSFMISTAGRIIAEKESDTWLTLLSTPVDASEILVSKALGAIWDKRVALIFLLLACVLGLISDAIHPVFLLLTLFISAIELAFFLILGMRFGLTSKTFQAASSKSIMTWIIITMILPICIGIMTSEIFHPTYFAIAPMVSEFSVNDPINPNNPIHNALIKMIPPATVTLILIVVVGLMIFQSTIQNFDKLNDRTRNRPDEGL